MVKAPPLRRGEVVFLRQQADGKAEGSEKMLHHLKIKSYKTISGKTQDIDLSYQVFGKELHSAPIVLVNHALTGNSNVTGKSGWWSALIGDKKCIDTKKYTVLAFNIPILN